MPQKRIQVIDLTNQKNQQQKQKSSNKKQQQKTPKPVKNTKQKQQYVQDVNQQPYVTINIPKSMTELTKFDDKHIIYAGNTYSKSENFFSKDIKLFNVETNKKTKLFSVKVKKLYPLREQYINQLIVTNNSKYVVLVFSHQINIFDIKSRKEVDVLTYLEKYSNSGEINKVVYLEKPNLLAILSNSDDVLNFYDLTKQKKVELGTNKKIPYISSSIVGVGDKKNIFYNPYKKEILIPFHLELIRISAETCKQEKSIDFKSIVTNAEKIDMGHTLKNYNPIMGDIDGKYLYLYSHYNPDLKGGTNLKLQQKKYVHLNGIIRINLMNYKIDRITYPKNYKIKNCMSYEKNQMIVLKSKPGKDNIYISIDTIKGNKMITERVIYNSGPLNFYYDPVSEITGTFTGNKFLLFGKTLYYKKDMVSLVKIELENIPDIPEVDKEKVKDFNKSKFYVFKRNYDEPFRHNPDWKLIQGPYGDYIKTKDRLPKNISLKHFKGDYFTAEQNQLATYIEGKSKYNIYR